MICYAKRMATNKRKDFTQTALSVVQQATGEATLAAPTKKQESGRKGGIVGGKSRALKLSQEQRTEIAKVAASARWKKG